MGRVTHTIMHTMKQTRQPVVRNVNVYRHWLGPGLQVA
jgi:hypothetical protein